MLLPFVKMEGLGNDFLVIDRHDVPMTPELAIKLCDRRFGIGADQILWLRQPQDASCDTRMEILNADGSTAEMCGNGIRAVALHLAETRARKSSYRVETLAGIKIVELTGQGNVRVDMGPPGLGESARAGESICAAGREFRFHEVSMGNPHAVIFTENASAVPLAEWGPELEKHARFPKKTNVEFVEIQNEHAIRARVWERGAGITLACGTGACASAVAAIATGRARSPVSVELPGGKLVIEWDGARGAVFMQGPARAVFRGEVEI